MEREDEKSPKEYTEGQQKWTDCGFNVGKEIGGRTPGFRVREEVNRAMAAADRNQCMRAASEGKERQEVQDVKIGEIVSWK